MAHTMVFNFLLSEVWVATSSVANTLGGGRDRLGHRNMATNKLFVQNPLGIMDPCLVAMWSNPPFHLTPP